MELTEMPLSQLSENVSNPRTITDTKLERLVESILVFPRMLPLRPIVVDENNVILGGNMRFRALSRISSMKFPSLKKTLSGSVTFTKKTEFEREQLLDYWRTWLRSPVAPVSTAASLSSDERREFIIKDNVGFGEWDTDALSDDWSDIDFDEWGLDGLLIHDSINKKNVRDKDLSDKVGESYEVVVECSNEAEQENMFNDLTEKGYKCRLLTL